MANQSKIAVANVSANAAEQYDFVSKATPPMKPLDEEQVDDTTQSEAIDQPLAMLAKEANRVNDTKKKLEDALEKTHLAIHSMIGVKLSINDQLRAFLTTFNELINWPSDAVQLEVTEVVDYFRNIKDAQDAVKLDTWRCPLLHTNWEKAGADNSAVKCPKDIKVQDKHWDRSLLDHYKRKHPDAYYDAELGGQGRSATTELLCAVIARGLKLQANGATGRQEMRESFVPPFPAPSLSSVRQGEVVLTVET